MELLVAYQSDAIYFAPLSIIFIGRKLGPNVLMYK